MSRRDIIAIGGSLGAVDAVKKLVHDLPADLAASLFIVIHVGDQGRDLLADILNSHSGLSISTAVDGEVMRLGHAYVAPAGRHLLVLDGVIRLGRGPRENLARPAIDPLFRSAAMSFGSRTIAVVLTGMLNDGAGGLADVKRCGGITIVQNPADAVASEMPWGALRASDVDYRTPLSGLAALLVKLVGEEAGPGPGVPPDITSEVEIALGRKSDSKTLGAFADPVALSCPDCGGVLSEIRRSPPLRFRCQVGHSYTAEVLAGRKEGAVDEAIRVALRIIEERTLLLRKLSQEAQRSGLQAAAASYNDTIERCRSDAEVLQKAIVDGSLS